MSGSESEFRTTGIVDVVLNESSVRQARKDLESELGAAATVSVDASGVATAGARPDGGASVKASLASDTSDLVGLAEGRNETLVGIRDTLEDDVVDAIHASDDGGGGLGGILRSVGGLLGNIGTLSVGALAVGTLTASQIVDLNQNKNNRDRDRDDQPAEEPQPDPLVYPPPNALRYTRPGRGGQAPQPGSGPVTPNLPVVTPDPGDAPVTLPGGGGITPEVFSSPRFPPEVRAALGYGTAGAAAAAAAGGGFSGGPTLSKPGGGGGQLPFAFYVPNPNPGFGRSRTQETTTGPVPVTIQDGNRARENRPDKVQVEVSGTVRVDGMGQTSTEIEKVVDERVAKKLEQQFGTNGRGVRPDTFR